MAFVLNPARFSGGGYVINKSVVFSDDDSSKLTWTPSSNGSTTKGTISVWVKRANLGTEQVILDAKNSGETLHFNTSDKLVFWFAGGAKQLITTQVFRDPIAWYHIVLRLDTTTVEADRMRMYVNGVEVTAFDLDTRPTPSQAFSWLFKSAVLHTIGFRATAASYLDAYLAEFVLIDGTSYGPDSFGKFDKNGNWVPIDPLPIRSRVIQSYDNPGGTGDRTADIIVTDNMDGTSFGTSELLVNGSATANVSNGFLNDATGAKSAGDYIRFDFGNARIISEVTMKCGTPDGIDTAKWRGSNNASDWTDLGSTFNLMATTTDIIDLSNTTAYRYYQLEIVTSSGAGGNYWTEWEFKIDGIPGFGTNGFWLNFDDASNLGADAKLGTGFINASEGNAIGDLTLHGGLAGGFDSAYDETASGAAKASGTGYIGKTWASAKTCTGFYVESYSNYGFVQGATPTVTCTVYGKNGSAPSSSTDGTSLYTDSQTDGNNILTTFQSDAITATSYDHIWVEISSAGANVHVSELEFYENNGVIGRRNNFTSSGLTASDQVTDSPTDDAKAKEDVYCVMRAEGGGGVVSEGGLVVDCDDESCRGTVYKSDGLFYFEQILDVGTTNATVIGISEDTGTIKGSGGSHTLHEAQADAYAWYNVNTGGLKVDQSGVTTAYGTMLIDQDTVLQCAVNLTLGYIWFGTDDTWFDPAGVASSATVKASMEAGESTYAAFTGVSGNFTPYHMNANANAVRFNFGATAFYYTPPSGFDAWVEKDVSRPVGNYATLNPLNTEDMVLSNGNLRIFGVSAGYETSVGTIGVTSGKYYYEVTVASTDVSNSIGWCDETFHGAQLTATNPHRLAGAYSWGLAAIYNDTATSALGTTQVNGDVLMVAVDIDAGEVWFGKNGVWFGNDPDAGVGDIISMPTGNVFFPVHFNFGSDGDYTFNFGQNAFSGSAPAGFKSLCTANLAKPAIQDPSAQFQTTLYSGNATASTDIIQSESKTFTPDIVLIKNRDTTDQWKFVDAVRGATNEINTDGTDAESADANGLTGFNPNGFKLGTGANGYNDSGESFVAYQFNAGNSEVVNSDGTVDVTQRASAVSGISIGTFTTPASGTFTLGHGLTKAPGFVAIKQLDAVSGWWTHVSGLDANQYLRLEGTDAVATSTTAFNNVLPTSSVVSSTSGGTWLAASTSHLLWCMESIEGFSKQFSYTGNGSVDGPYVNLGFKPEFLVLKRTAGADPWWVLSDKMAPYNLVDPYLQLDGALAESTLSTQSDLDFVSSGFKLRTLAGGTNASGALYIGFAFSKHPFGGKGVSQARAR